MNFDTVTSVIFNNAIETQIFFSISKGGRMKSDAHSNTNKRDTLIIVQNVASIKSMPWDGRLSQDEINQGKTPPNPIKPPMFTEAKPGESTQNFNNLGNPFIPHIYKQTKKANGDKSKICILQ